MKSEVKLNSEHLFELVTIELNAIWKMEYFVWYFLNTTVFEFSKHWYSNYNSKEICLAAPNGIGN